MDLQLSYEHVSDFVTVVTVDGAVDVCSAAKVRNLLVDLVSHGRVFLVLDLSMLDWADSTGFGVVVGGLRGVRRYGGGMALVVTHERIAKLFQIQGLTRVFPIFDLVDPAVESLSREVPGLNG
ncbi:anti-sigma factor antagonist [Streptomyces sp. NBC_01565]|uniref:anti-sigma factor antagonist n=1 Tax=Streptomyces sp. NBC_01565 TaxID=2975881 RepID=UPI0022566DA9|nr:anti-sigma factor antagonist [Streptomyces sp. NBC_01565]MCX4546867.1 anti-sigma factor antagonist [Streptomyces sp. NBC_01565]